MPDDENFILTGKEEDLESQIVQFAAIHQLLKKFNSPQCFGIPVEDIDSSFRYRPHVYLFFKQPEKEVVGNYSAVKAEISFRLMSYQSETITQANIEALSNRVKTLFGGASEFFFNKGKNYYSYIDKAKGYKMQVLCSNENEARKVFEQVLDVQNHSPDWKNFYISSNGQPAQKWDDTPGSTIILSKSHKKPRRRPLAKVVFQSAWLKLWNLEKWIQLCPRLELPK